MEKFNIEKVSVYANNGQASEQDLRFAITGKLLKADHNEGNDLGDMQIKSARATICKGTDIEGFVKKDPASRYAYVTKDRKVYVMNKTEYITFARSFSTVTRESNKNGGAVKTRFRYETPTMLTWLEAYLNG